MLVLTRKPTESITITDQKNPGTKIVISINSIQGRYAKIGISAPSHILIYRNELYDQIAKEKAQVSILSNENPF